MNKKILIITCMMLSLMVLSACHLGNNLVAEPSPAQEATPVAETVVQTSEPTLVPTPVPTPEPTPEPTLQPTPTPFTPTPVPGPAVLITKNPSSESLAIGGKTWFIAHAENAYSLTWELVDPNGNIHSVSDAMAQNPGLLLEILEGDTIAVSNVPLSLNGWGVQARFDGQGNSATTSPAYIYVGDFANAYNSVIEKYRIAKQANISSPKDAYDHDVSEHAIYGEHVGYALKDLDKNGIPELIIANTSTQYGKECDINDLYTLVNNTPVRLQVSANRSNMYLLSDNQIYIVSSGGASISIHELYSINDNSLHLNECFFSYYDSPEYGLYFYHITSKDENLLGPTPPANYDYRIPLDDFHNQTEEAIRAKIWLPQLTIIA